jgi:hypothetical protein
VIDFASKGPCSRAANGIQIFETVITASAMESTFSISLTGRQLVALSFSKPFIPDDYETMQAVAEDAALVIYSITLSM